MNEIKIRQIQQTDLLHGFLKSLDSLRKASDLDQEKAIKIFEKIKSNPDHVIFVAVLEDRIVGSTTLFIEPKFIHNGGFVAHIEDVVISKDLQRKGIGKKLILASLEYAKNNGCYKTILDCADDLKSFYEKIGFKKYSNAMRYDHN